MLNNIVNDLRRLQANLQDDAILKDTPHRNNWRMYWSDDWLSSAGEDVSLDSEADDERSHMTRSHNGSLGSDDKFNIFPADRIKKAPQVALKPKPLPRSPTPRSPTPRSPTTPTPLLMTLPEKRSITILERVTKTHPVWFLPEMSRAGAVHLLKDKEPGTFIVRRSSQLNTWALSIHQLKNNQSMVDHYLIEGFGSGYCLQGSHHSFKDLPALIAYYCQFIDELPEMLVLPSAIRTAATTQQLSSLALLGQDFWTMSKDYPKISPEKENRIYISSKSAMHKSVSQPEHMEKFGFQALNPVCNNQLNKMGNVSTFMNRKKSSQSQTYLLNNGRVNNYNNHTHHITGNKPLNHNIHDLHLSGYRLDKHKAELNRPSTKEVPCYRSTSMDMLLLPEEYNASKLSDRMSDYSDVWKTAPSHPRHSSNSSLEDNFYDATSDVYSDTPSWSYHASDNNLRDTPTSDHSSQSPTKHTRVKDHNIRSPTQTFNTNFTDNTKSDSHKIHESKTSGICSSNVSNSPDKTPTAKSSVFHYSSDDNNTNSASPYDNKQKRHHTRGKPPRTPTKPTRRFCVRSNSSPSMCPIKMADDTKPFDTLDSNSNEIYDLQSYIKQPRSSLWLRRWRSLPFRLKYPDSGSDPSSRSSPFEAVSPKFHRHIMLKNNLNVQTECGNSNDVTLRTKYNVTETPLKSRKSPVPSPRSNQTLPAQPANKPNVLPLDQQVLLTSNNCINSLNSPSSNRFPLYSSQFSANSETSTVCDIITKIAPELLVRNVKPLTVENLQHRASQYDNLSRPSRPVSLQTVNSTATEYCRPWESSFWDSILKPLPQQCFKQNSPCTENGSHISLSSSRASNRLSLTSQLSNSEQNTACDRTSDRTYGKAWEITSPRTHSTTNQINRAPDTTSASNRIHTSHEGEIRSHKRLSRSGTKSHTSNQNVDVTDKVLYTTDQNGIDTSNRTDKNDKVDRRNDKPVRSPRAADQVMIRTTTSITKNEPSNANTDSHNDAAEEPMKRSTRSVLSISMDATEEVVPVGAHVDNDDEEEEVFNDSGPASRVSSQSGQNGSQTGKANKAYVCHVREYLLKLSQDQTTTFGSAVENFVKCTLESNETQAHVVMRNARQFMNGIKNYLVTSGEGELACVIEEERSKLNSNTILNIDAIIEGTLHRCVLRPLKYHIYRLLVDHYRTSGELRLMSVNVKYGRTLTSRQLGVLSASAVPGAESMECIRHFLVRMQRAYSPLKKLEHFLSAVSAIYASQNKDAKDTVQGSPVGLGADDFLPMLVYVLVDCGLVSAEIEAEYMWGLLHPSILTGEGGYYLTTLSSAIHAIKNIRSSLNDKHFPAAKNLGESGESRGSMRVVIPDELCDSIVWKTLPVRPNIATKDVCMMLAHKLKTTRCSVCMMEIERMCVGMMLAHKLKITNPQDYALFCLYDGDGATHRKVIGDGLGRPFVISGAVKTLLKDTACPHTEHPDPRIKFRVFAYKRKAANIAWPKSFNV